MGLEQFIYDFEERAGEMSPSHPVGLELRESFGTSPVYFVSPSHTVGLEHEGVVLGEVHYVRSPSHTVGLERL